MGARIPGALPQSRGAGPGALEGHDLAAYHEVVAVLAVKCVRDLGVGVGE